MTPRPSRVGEERALKALWKEVFGDSDEYIDTFFREVYRPGMASVIEENGEIAAAAYAVPFGKYRYIYAVATKPEYRGRGYGKAVTLAASGGEAAYLCPADATLRCWYALSMRARTVSYRSDAPLPPSVRKITAEEFRARREVWLDGIPHAKYSDGILKLFSVTGEFFCGEHGDIYAVDDGRVCEALPARAGDEPFLMGLNGAEPIYWGLALE